jgi:hypothetical protein
MKRVFLCCFLYLVGCSQAEAMPPTGLPVVLSQMSDGMTGDDKEVRVPPTSVAEIEAALALLLAEHYPDAEVVDASSVHYRVKFDTMRFHVHGRDKMGRISSESHETEGPNNLGFILDVKRRDEKYLGAAIVPQTFQNPYWETWGYELQPEGSGLSVRFSYGQKVKPEFLKAIIDLLRHPK